MGENQPLEKENEKILKTDKNGVMKLANAFFILSVIGLILTGLVLFSFLTLIFYYLILALILILTLFILFNKIKPWFDYGESVQQFLETMYQYVPYVIGIGLGSGVIALIFYIVFIFIEMLFD